MPDNAELAKVARDESVSDVERLLAALVVLESEGGKLDGPRLRRYLGWGPGRLHAAMREARIRGWITYGVAPPI